MAKRCGVKIEAFSIGFGQEIFGWTDKAGTRWKVCWLPLGGYVKMFGDANPASMPGDGVKTMTEAEKKVSFFYQNVNKRMAIVVAGPATNYIFAIIVLAVLFAFNGQPYTAPDISSVKEGSAAAHAGLMKGDHVVAIDGDSIQRFEDIKRVVALNEGTPIRMEIDRGGKNITFNLTPDIITMTDRFGGEHKLGQIGITSDELKFRQLSPPQILVQATLQTWQLTTDTLKAIGQIILGARGTEELGGPLRIADMLGHAAQAGFMPWVQLVAFISVNLGLINLFPIPLLDGGHLAFYAIEKIQGRPLHDRIQDIGMRIGMALVLSLMVFSTWNDLVHLKVVSYLRTLLFS